MLSKRYYLGFLARPAVLWRVAATSLLFGLAGLGYAQLSPKWYRSTLTVAPAKTQRTGLSALAAGSDLGALAAGFDATVGGTADVARVAAVLQSNTVTDAVIQKFGLLDRYEDRYLEQAREDLWKHCEVKALPKPNLVQLSCEDFDSRFVQDMLSYFASYGNEVFRRVNASSATEEVRFLVRRVDELRQEADRSASLLREFQEQHQIVDLDTQAKAVVSTLAALNAQRISKQLELDLGRQFSSSDEPAIRQLESQLWVVEERMRDLKGGTKGSSGTEGARDSQASDARRGLFPAALAVPSLRAKYEILYRDRRVGEAALLFALERLEGARANEARDVSTYQVLDPPALATRHSRPKRLPFLVGSALLGFVLSVVVEAWRNRRPTVSA